MVGTALTPHLYLPFHKYQRETFYVAVNSTGNSKLWWASPWYDNSTDHKQYKTIFIDHTWFHHDCWPVKKPEDPAVHRTWRPVCQANLNGRKPGVLIGYRSLHPNPTCHWAKYLNVSTRLVTAYAKWLFCFCQSRSQNLTAFEKPVHGLFWFHLILLHVGIQPMKIKWRFLCIVLNEYMSHIGDHLDVEWIVLFYYFY